MLSQASTQGGKNWLDIVDPSLFGEDKRDHLSTLELSQTIREWFLFLSLQSTIHSTATTNRFQNCQIVGLQETSHFKRPLWNGM